MTAPRVLSVSVGGVQSLRWHGRAVPSGIAKVPVSGPVAVGKRGVVGDEQGDRRNHGGPDKAILAYPDEHYQAWGDDLGTRGVPSFGENLTITGLLETGAVIGSVYNIGTATVQVSQPRRPCFKLAAFHGIDDLAVVTQRTGRTGFYLRVLVPGRISSGNVMMLQHAPRHGITVAEVHRVLNIDRGDVPAIRRLLDEPGVLPQSWSTLLRKRLAGRRESDSRRLHGRPPDAPG